MNRALKFPAQGRADGAALISALFTVALATLLATQLITAQRDAIQNLIGRQDLAQARWLARGATDWARAILAEDARTSQTDHLGEPWAIKVPPIPIQSGKNQDLQEGELSGEIVELDGRFNLNRLVSAGNVDRGQVQVFIRLLIGLDVPASEAERLAQTLVDWLDLDSQTLEGEDEKAHYGIAFDNQPLLGVGGLLRVPGFTAATVSRMHDVVSALPRQVPLNLNTASIKVMAAEMPELEIEAIQRAVAERERAPFRDIADFNARVIGAAANTRFGVVSSHFQVTTRASYGESVVQLRTLVYRGSGGQWPDILWQQIL